MMRDVHYVITHMHAHHCGRSGRRIVCVGGGGLSASLFRWRPRPQWGCARLLTFTNAGVM